MTVTFNCAAQHTTLIFLILPTKRGDVHIKVRKECGRASSASDVVPGLCVSTASGRCDVIENGVVKVG